MDIVTHAMSGVVIGAPLLPTRPIAGGCFVLGCVLPDLDVLARLFGKVSFLRWHQTWTHSFVGIAALGGLAFLLADWAGLSGTEAAAALAAGMLLHVLLDWSNTYGVALLTPMSRKRFCAEWVFFIDAVTVVATTAALAMVLPVLLTGGEPLWQVSAGFLVFLVIYGVARFLLRRRAGRAAPAGTNSLVPSALWPWRFHGYVESNGKAMLFRLNALTGVTTTGPISSTPDVCFVEWLEGIDEYRLMRSLSAGYRLVEAREHGDDVTLVCCDLRTRNFGGRFGRLEVVFDTSGRLKRKVFHV